jgi:diacylglycerol kinase family enzyme
MCETRRRAEGTRRLAAIGAFLIVAVVAGVTLVRIASDPGLVVIEFALLAVSAVAGWIALTRIGSQRIVAIVIVLVAFAGLVVSIVRAEGAAAISLAVRILAVAGAVALGRYALGTTDAELKRATTPGTPVPAARRGVLFMNLKSGGGKAERFHLVDECRRRGIEPVVFEPGQDWLQIVRDHAASGRYDVLGMAGGDGSQAMVGTVAAEFGLPMVVVPAGTRNHLALDLGLDREDVLGALEAYGDAMEREMSLADVNGHVFVNNVSLGLYAAVVRSPEYRDAKVDTTLATLPQVLGPETEPFDLRFVGPDGTERRQAHVIQIANNPYGETVGGFGSRPRMDTGLLGVVSVDLGEAGSKAGALLASLATGHTDRFDGFWAWSTPTFEVTSDAPIEIGLDGETMTMDPPLRFTIRPDRVRVRLPKGAIGYSPAARSLGWRETTCQLFHVAFGRRFHLPD